MISNKKEEVLPFSLCCHDVLCICNAELYCVFLLPFYILNLYLFCRSCLCSQVSPCFFDLKILYFFPNMYMLLIQSFFINVQFFLFKSLNKILSKDNFDIRLS